MYRRGPGWKKNEDGRVGRQGVWLKYCRSAMLCNVV